MKSILLMCFCFWNLTGFVFPEKKSEKKSVRPTVEKALNVLKGQTEESLMVLLKSQMSSKDAVFIQTQLRKLKVDPKAALGVQIIDKNVLIWNNQKFSVRNNGKEIQYKTHTFRLNKNDSIEKNIIHFIKKMTPQKVVKSFSLLPKAFAQERVFGGPIVQTNVTQSAVNLVRALKHLEKYLQWDSETYRLKAEAFQRSTLFNFPDPTGISQ